MAGKHAIGGDDVAQSRVAARVVALEDPAASESAVSSKEEADAVRPESAAISKNATTRESIAVPKTAAHLQDVTAQDAAASKNSKSRKGSRKSSSSRRKGHSSREKSAPETKISDSVTSAETSEASGKLSNQTGNGTSGETADGSMAAPTVALTGSSALSDSPTSLESSVLAASAGSATSADSATPSLVSPSPHSSAATAPASAESLAFVASDPPISKPPASPPSASAPASADSPASKPSSSTSASSRRSSAHSKRPRFSLRNFPLVRAFLRVAEVVVVVAAVGIIVSTFFISVLQIRGTSMAPTLREGDLVVTNHSNRFATGDMVAFYYNNRVLLKRVIGFPGDWVDIKPDGTVYVNDVQLHEDYVQGLSFGETDIVFPYQVPENRYFVLGDHRNVSIDSRSEALGTVSEEQIVGKVLMRVWPLTAFGPVG